VKEGGDWRPGQLPDFILEHLSKKGGRGTWSGEKRNEGQSEGRLNLIGKQATSRARTVVDPKLLLTEESTSQGPSLRRRGNAL